MKIKTFLFLILLILNITTAAGCGLFYDFESAGKSDSKDIYQESDSVKDDGQDDQGADGNDTGQAEVPNNDASDTVTRYRVPEVIDGDTVILSNGDHIRLLVTNGSLRLITISYGKNQISLFFQGSL